MRFSEFQKELIKRISNYQIPDLKTFIIEYFPIHDIHKEDLSSHNFSGRQFNVIILSDFEGAHNMLCEFLFLLKFLNNNNLIYCNNESQYDIHFIDNDNSHLNTIQKINTLFSENHIHIYYPTPFLIDFINRDYLTEDDYYRKEEDKDRKKAQSLTRLIALISIVLSFASAMLNFLIFSNDRDVNIKNINAFKDTTKILIIQNNPYIDLDIFKDSSGYGPIYLETLKDSIK